MKKLMALSFSILALSGLAACGGRCCKKQTPCCTKEECTEQTVEQPKRISGPVADKEIGWEKEDYQ